MVAASAEVLAIGGDPALLSQAAADVMTVLPTSQVACMEWLCGWGQINQVGTSKNWLSQKINIHYPRVYIVTISSVW